MALQSEKKLPRGHNHDACRAYHGGRAEHVCTAQEPSPWPRHCSNYVSPTQYSTRKSKVWANVNLYVNMNANMNMTVQVNVNVNMHASTNANVKVNKNANACGLSRPP